MNTSGRRLKAAVPFLAIVSLNPIAFSLKPTQRTRGDGFDPSPARVASASEKAPAPPAFGLVLADLSKTRLEAV